MHSFYTGRVVDNLRSKALTQGRELDFKFFTFTNIQGARVVICLMHDISFNLLMQLAEVYRNSFRVPTCESHGKEQPRT